MPPAAEGIESPYDPEARYRHKRDTQWTGYMVHVSETCEPTAPHLLTQEYTTPATVHEALCTEPIEQALVDKGVPPHEHLVDAAYISAELLGWQTKVDGAYSVDQFTVDWERQEVWCPQGKQAVSWTEYVDRAHKPWIIVQFSRKDCSACPTRAACTRAQHKARSLHLPPQEQYEALQACGRGMPVPRANASMRAARESKGPSRRACGPSGCGGHAIGAWRKPTCSTSRRPRRSISTALWRGSTNARGHKRVPPVSPPSLLPAPYPLGHCLAKPPAALQAHVMSLLGLNPTATLLEHTLLTQGFTGTSKSAFPRSLRPQNHDSTWANLVNTRK